MSRSFLGCNPQALPENAKKWSDNPETQDELDPLRVCVCRRRPFGSLEWLTLTSKRLALETTPVPEADQKETKTPDTFHLSCNQPRGATNQKMRTSAGTRVLRDAAVPRIWYNCRAHKEFVKNEPSGRPS